MSEYETEEQQLAALKKWWKENGTSIIIGLFIGTAVLFGWRYYDEQSYSHSVQASDLYMKVYVATVNNTVNDEIIDISNTLINEYSDTPYAALSALSLAKTDYEKGDVDSATTQLELAIKHANDETVKQIANLRLANVYLDQNKQDEALMLLSEPHDSAFDAHYEELKGDIYHAKGDNEKAGIAYDKAISLLDGAAGKWLLLKRKNLKVDNADSDTLSSAVINIKIVS